MRPPSERLACPICQDTLHSCVITPCVHTFCSPCLHQAIAISPRCPLCRAPVTPDDVRANTLVQDLLDELEVYCPYSDSGCSLVFPQAQSPDHKLACPYRPASCPYRNVGCTFAGTHAAVEAHTDMTANGDCPYAAVSPYILEVDAKIANLQDALDRKSAEISALRAFVAALDPPTVKATLATMPDPFAHVILHGDPNNPLSPNVLTLLNEHFPPPPVPPSAAPSPSSSSSPSSSPPASSSASSLSSPGRRSSNSGQEPETGWSPVDMECMRSIKGHTAGVTAVTLGPDFLYSGSQDTTVRVWSLDSFECLALCEGHSYTVWSLVVTLVPVPGAEDGRVVRRLFSGSSDGTVSVWTAAVTTRIRDGPPVSPRFERDSVIRHTGKVYAMVVYEPLGLLFSADGTGLLLVTHTWSLETLVSLTVGNGDAGVMAFSLQDQTLLIASASGIVYSLDLGPLHTVLEGVDVTDPDFVPDFEGLLEPRAVCLADAKILDLCQVGSYVFASCSTSIIKVFSWSDDRASLVENGALKGHRWPVWQMGAVEDSGASSPPGAGWVVSASFDHRMKITRVDPTHQSSQPDTNRFDCVRTIDAHNGYIHALTQGVLPSTSTRVFISGSGDRTIRVWAVPII